MNSESINTILDDAEKIDYKKEIGEAEEVGRLYNQYRSINDEDEEVQSSERQRIDEEDAIHDEFVNTMITLNHQLVKASTQEEKEEILKKMDLMDAFLHGYHTEEHDYRACKSGYLGEVAMFLAFEEMGFKVDMGTRVDDRNKIDIWVNDGDGHLFAVQVKTSVAYEKFEFHNLEKNRFDRSGGMNNLEDSVRKLRGQGLLPDTGEKIIPIYVRIPGGLSNTKAMYNGETGRPSQELIDELRDLVFSEVWDYEDELQEIREGNYAGVNSS